ncbi:adenylate kinase 7-like, partial [Diretmus argenteus]
VIQNVIDRKPKPRYLLAVDNSNNTMEDVVTTLASVLGPGQIQKKPCEDAFLTRDLSQMEIDSLLVNLHMEAVHLKELLNVQWVCEAGLVENMEMVVEEYRQTRELLPLRLCILGPPAAGKSTVADQLCKHYKLHQIRLKETISETIAQLEAAVKNEDEEAEKEESAQELLNTLKDNMEQNGGGDRRLEEPHVIRVMKDKLMSKRCRNQGFVLDGFPETYEQAKELFYAEEDESEEARSKIPKYNKKIIPEFVFCLDASDAFLKDRVLNLPERLPPRYRHGFLRRLNRYRNQTIELLNYFHELDISPQDM